MRALLLVLAALCLLGSPLAQAKGFEGARDEGLRYLETQVRAGTGALAPNVVEALVANGLDPAAWPSTEDSALRQVRVPEAGSANITLLRPVRALALAGVDVYNGPHGNLVQRVVARFSYDNGQYGSPQVLNDDAFSLLALQAAGFTNDNITVSSPARFLLDQQAGDGGWGWAVGAPSSTDMTGMVQEALLGAGAGTTASRVRALAFVESTRDANGGYGEGPGDAPNCESTVWALRLQARSGLDPAGADWRFLLSLQRADGGFAHVPGGPSDLLCSAEAVTLLGEVGEGRVPFRLGTGPGDDILQVPPAGAAVTGLAFLAIALLRRV